MILVTGATGTVGSELMKNLIQMHIPVRALVRKASDKERLQAQGVDIVLGELARKESIQQALEGIDSVYLLSPSSPQLPAIEQQFTQVAREAGIKHLVKHSIIGAGDPTASIIANWHTQGEEAIRQSGLSYTFLRPNCFTQNIVPTYSTSIKRHGVLYTMLDDACISCIDVRDIADVAAQVLTQEGHAGEAYTLTGPEAITIQQLVEKLSYLLGTQVRASRASDEETRTALISLGVPDWNADAMIALNQFYRRGGAQIVTDLVEKITGHSARTVDEYLRENIQAFKENQPVHQT